MMIALFTILFLGGGSDALLGFIAESQDNVKIVMVRDERQKSALATLKLMKKITKVRNKKVKKAAKDLAKAFNHHSVTVEQVDAIWAGYFTNIDQHNHDMLDLRFELKEHINREEWEAIFPKAKQLHIKDGR